MLVGMLIDHINSVADARPKIVAAVAHAKRDPGLKRLSKTEDGNIQMLTYWNHLTAEDRLPPKKFMKDFAKVSKNALTGVAARWTTAHATPRKPNWYVMPG